jgi:hypothetical protein
MKIALVAFLLLASTIVTAMAQATVDPLTLIPLGTQDTKANNTFSGGKLNGCGVEFNVFARDFTYKQGGYVTVGGQVGIMLTKNGFIGMVKVVLHDVGFNQKYTFTPSPPARAYLIAADLSTNAASFLDGGPSDNPGASFTVFKAAPTLDIIVEGLRNNLIKLGINRTADGIALPIDINTSVEDASKNLHSYKTRNDFLTCAARLIKNAEGQIPMK